MIGIAPDKFNRFVLAARYIESLCQNGLNRPRILDLGSNENLLTYFLNGYPVIQADIVASPSALNFIKCSAESIPFPDNSIDIVVCLDVLEHVHASKRNRILDEIIRITAHSTILAFPIAHSNNTTIELLFSELWERLYQAPNEFLMEHRKYGLVNPSGVIEHLKKSFQHNRLFFTFPWQFWLLSNLVERYLGMLSKTEAIKESLNQLFNTVPVRSLDITEAYRAFIIAGHKQYPPIDEQWFYGKMSSDEELTSSNIVEPIISAQTALEQLNVYARDLENKLKKTTCELEKANHQNERFKQELKQYGQTLSADYDALEKYALHLENTILNKDNMIVDLQEQLTNLLTERKNRKFKE